MGQGLTPFLGFIYLSHTMAPKRKKRSEQNLEDEQFFRHNALRIIAKMLELEMNTPPSEQPTALVDEILHSIFFLGQLRKPKCTPDMIITTADKLENLRQKYPQPFERYSSQLPKRSPFSCVQDMVVHQIGQEKKSEILQMLQDLIMPLEGGTKKPLVSTTICVSKYNNSDRYYGVSMSTTGKLPGRIMVAASCLSTYWDSYVAGAVMTYYPTNEKKSNFDGTFKLPVQEPTVRCEAFNLSDGKEMVPCISCGHLFGLTNSAGREWPYGNCAEAESLSNLFKNVREVRKKVRPRSEENREPAVQSVLKELKGFLRTEKFRYGKEINFYTPQ